MELWDFLSETVLKPGVEDWKLLACGHYSAKSVYRGFFQGAILFEPWARIWKTWEPCKHRFFMWLVAHNKYWTADRLAGIICVSERLKP